MRLIEQHPGRVGYLLKERVFDVAILVDALRRIADDETVVDPTIVARLLGRRRREDPIAELSPREREVLSLLAEAFRTAPSPPASSSPAAPSRRTSSRSSSSSACRSRPTSIAECSQCSPSSGSDRQDPSRLPLSALHGGYG